MLFAIDCETMTEPIIPPPPKQKTTLAGDVSETQADCQMIQERVAGFIKALNEEFETKVTHMCVQIGRLTVDEKVLAGDLHVDASLSTFKGWPIKPV